MACSGFDEMTLAMTIHSSGFTYEWIENWVRIPDNDLARASGRTHALAYSASRDRVFVFHHGTPAVLVCTRDGVIKSAWGERFTMAHGMSLVEENGEEFLWLVDEHSHEIIKTTLDGREVLALQKPDLPAYGSGGERGGNYVPTWAAQNPLNGDVWVADGYGSWLVHRYDHSGRWIQTFDGVEGAGRFSEPHGIAVFVRNKMAEVFVTDRANHRIVVYDADGHFLRHSLSAHSPCCFDMREGVLLVPELFSGIKLLRAATLEPIAALGDHPDVGPREDGGWWPPRCPEGWPNLAGTESVRPGWFNSPHGACFGPDGEIYVGEWIIGGRLTKLTPIASGANP